MSKSENEDASRLHRLDAIAHKSFGLFGELHKPISITTLDEPITVRVADPLWPTWFQREAALLWNTLPGHLTPEIQHIGSTAVPGLDAKPIVDLMVGLSEPGRIAEVVERLDSATKALVKPECLVDGLCENAIVHSTTISRWSRMMVGGGGSTSRSAISYVRMPRPPGITLWQNGVLSKVARICCSLIRTRSTPSSKQLSQRRETGLQ